MMEIRDKDITLVYALQESEVQHGFGFAKARVLLCVYICNFLFVLLFKPQECRSLGHVQGPVDRRRKSGTL